MRKRGIALALCTLAILAGGCTPSESSAAPTPAPPTPTPYGEQIPIVGATASSETAWGAANVFDGILRTKWRPAGKEVEWVAVDLGESHAITRVIVYWTSGIDCEAPTGENYHATDYEVQVSDDGESWTTIRSIAGGDGEVDDFTGLDVTGRYVRVYCTKPSELTGAPDPYNVWEIEVYAATS